MNDRSPDTFALSLSPLSSSVRQRFVGAFWHLCVVLIQTPSRNSNSSNCAISQKNMRRKFFASGEISHKFRGGLSIRRNREMNFSTDDLYRRMSYRQIYRIINIYWFIKFSIKTYEIYDIYVSLFLSKERKNVNYLRNLSWFY